MRSLWRRRWSNSRDMRSLWRRRGRNSGDPLRRRLRRQRSVRGGMRHHGLHRAADERRGGHRRLRRGGHRHAGGVRGIGVQLEAAIIARRVVGVMVEREIAEPLAGRRLLDVPSRVAGRAIPRTRAGQPSVLRQSLVFDLRADSARTVDADAVWRPAAARRCEARVDAAEILVDLVHRRAARIVVDREIDGAAGRLADRPRLAVRGLRVGIAGSIGEIFRLGRMPFPHRDDLHARRGQALRLGRRQGRPARGRIAIIAGDKVEPTAALQLSGDIAGIGCHVDAAYRPSGRRAHRDRHGFRLAGGQQQRREQRRILHELQRSLSPARRPKAAWNIYPLSRQMTIAIYWRLPDMRGTEFCALFYAGEWRGLLNLSAITGCR